MNNICDGCILKNINKNKKCAFHEHSLLCPCTKCIVKLVCKQQCKEFIQFFRTQGYVYFDKVNNIGLSGQPFEFISRKKETKLKRKKK